MGPLGSKMVRLRLLGLVVALAAVSNVAYGFQEQQATTPRQQDQAAQAVAPALAPDAAPASKGTPVRIPGLGTLGVIPKMDFGLELLYGAADPSSKRPEPNKPEQDDVLVGGRIKHKF
jgi:hypothetical protein